MASINAKLRVGDELRDLSIVNISASGFLARSQPVPPVGHRVHVQHRGASIVGTVVWATQTRFGVSSDGPIDLTAFLAKGSLGFERSVTDMPSRPGFWHWRTR